VARLRDAGSATEFEITLTEGRNRQVRRMVEALGARVVTLVRVKVGSLAIDTLPMGKWRYLTNAEVASFK
jgi:pseudouridine synthase